MTLVTENSKDDSSVRVALRVRPQSAAEKIDMCRVCTSVLPDGPQIVLGKDKAFTYDYVFDIASQQDKIYSNVAQELIEGCFEGYNATILAYGQTGSGKTYTMGTAFDVNHSLAEEQVGIIPRAIKHLFEGMQKRKQKAIDENRSPPEFKVQAQFMELYNEEIIDLLDIESKGRKTVKIHEDSNGNIYTTGILMRSVTSEKDIMKLLEEGALSRTTASTNMNATSSRSHAIFTVHLKHHRMVKIDQEDGDTGEETQGEEFETLTSKFNFVDLAGSERLKRTGATGDRAKEGISINQGLLSLGNVISALGDSTKRGCHVPYRDSKLTRLLQDSLGGNSRTVMIACVSPSDRDFMETLNTLKYANRARNIKNKVMVNQDKASKQIAALRNEIQSLQIELLEYKQGKRIADGEGGDQMSDVYHENTMLNSENENLRLRIKALQQTIDKQTQQISEFKASAVLGKVQGETDIEALVVGYVKEIEELSNKLVQSEAMSSAAVKRARAISRTAMSPGAPEDETASIIELAKLDLRKEKKKMRKEKNKQRTHSPSKLSFSESETRPEDQQPEEVKKENENKDQKESTMDVIEIIDTDEEQEEIEDDDDDEEDRTIGEEDDEDDDDDDDNISLAESSMQEEALREDIADLSTEITIKQKLVEELENSQKRLTLIKHQYEEKMSLLQTKIKETEDERDKVLKNIGSVDSKAAEKAKEIRYKYEKKLSQMQKELTKLQSAKREHNRLVKTKEQNEQQLKLVKSELGDLKKIKVKLMRQMRDEMSKAKQREGKFSTQLEQMIKENRKRDIQIKTLKQEQKQKDLVLKRKQEELNSIRKQIKPVSGNVGLRKKQEEESSRQRQQHSSLNGPSSHDDVRRRGASALRSPQRDPNQKPPVSSHKSPAVTRNAKKKWEMLERKMNDLMLKMKTVANMENDMERWLQDRDRISKQLEGCQKKKEEAIRMKRDESLINEFTEQHEALTAQMDYIQENITESQSTIMEMEDIGEMINSSEIMRGCSLSEAKYMLEHFYGKSVELGQELANKDAAYKELELRLEAMEQHCEVQQQLLQHVFVEKHFGEAGGDDEYRANGGEDVMGENGLEVHPNYRRISSKARRRTGCPEDFLKPAIKLRFSINGELPTKEQSKEAKKSIDNPRKGSDTPEVNQALMQKFMEIDKALKKKDKERKDSDAKLMPPPSMSRGLTSSSQSTNVEPRSRSLLQTAASKTLNNNIEKTKRSASFGSTGSLTEAGTSGNETLPASFQRGNRVSKSARTYISKGSSAASKSQQPSSANSSPKQLRKALSEDDKMVNPNPQLDVDSADVFTRLTSNLPQEADPDLGQMLPVKAPVGRPENLMCTHTATGHNNAVLSLAVTEDLLITGSKDRTAKIWDLNRGDEILSLAGHKRDVTVVRYSPVTKLVFTVNQSTIKIWDIRQNTGTCVKTLSGNFFQLGDSSIMDLGLNSSGNILYSALGNTVKMVDLKTYGTVGKLSGHTGAVTCLLVTQGDRRGDICVTGSKDHYIKVFEVLPDVTGSQMPRHNLEPPHYDGVQSLAIQDTTLFSGSRDNSIKKWNLNNHQLKHHVTTAHKDWVCSLNIIPNYNVLVSGCRSGVLKLWHSESCSQLGEINAHSRSINAIATNSSLLFTASSDRLVRIWKPTSTLDEQVQGANESSA